MSTQVGESEGGAKRASRPKLNLGISQNDSTNIARTPSPSTLLGGFSVSGIYNSAMPDFSPDPASRKNSRNPFADSFSEHIRRSSETENNSSLQVPKERDPPGSVPGNSPPHIQENGRHTPDIRPPQRDEIAAAQPPYVGSRGPSPAATPNVASPARRGSQAEGPTDMRQGPPGEPQQEDYSSLGGYPYGQPGQFPLQPQPAKIESMSYSPMGYHPYAANSAPQPQNPPSKLQPPPPSPAMPQQQPHPGYYKPPYPPAVYGQPYPPPSPAALNGYPSPLPYPPGVGGPMMGADPYGRPAAHGMYMGGAPPPVPMGFPGQAMPPGYGVEQQKPAGRKASSRGDTGKGDKRRRGSSPALSSAEDDTDGTADVPNISMMGGLNSSALHMLPLVGGMTGLGIGGDYSLEEARRRNRAAAMRCRQKKKLQMADLEKRANKLLDENKDLSNAVHTLRSEVLHLKELIIEHKKHCSLDFASTGSFTAPAQPKPSP